MCESEKESAAHWLQDASSIATTLALCHHVPEDDRAASWCDAPWLLLSYNKPIKLETGLRPNSAGIPYTLLLRIEAIGFPAFGLSLYTVRFGVLGYLGFCLSLCFAANLSRWFKVYYGTDGNSFGDDSSLLLADMHYLDTQSM